MMNERCPRSFWEMSREGRSTEIGAAAAMAAARSHAAELLATGADV